MLNLPGWMITILSEFAPVIYGISTWYKVEVLVTGAILTTGKRTVSAVLRVMGLSQEGHYAQYHHVLSRAVWSGLAGSAILRRRMLQTFDRGGVLVFGIDETIERRCGDKIAAKGIYRDGVRSSKSHFVKASGLRWISVMWLTTIPWAQRVWALPFFTVLAPSERYHQEHGQRHKTLPTWGRQMLLQRRDIFGRPEVLDLERQEFLAPVSVVCDRRAVHREQPVSLEVEDPHRVRRILEQRSILLLRRAERRHGQLPLLA